jgi:hypothetical protein
MGDGEVFSERLWWDYNQLKHDPRHEVDYGLLSILTHSYGAFAHAHG